MNNTCFAPPLLLLSLLCGNFIARPFCRILSHLIPNRDTFLLEIGLNFVSNFSISNRAVVSHLVHTIKCESLAFINQSHIFFSTHWPSSGLRYNEHNGSDNFCNLSAAWISLMCRCLRCLLTNTWNWFACFRSPFAFIPFFNWNSLWFYFFGQATNSKELSAASTRNASFGNSKWRKITE